MSGTCFGCQCVRCHRDIPPFFSCFMFVQMASSTSPVVAPLKFSFRIPNLSIVFEHRLMGSCSFTFLHVLNSRRTYFGRDREMFEFGQRKTEILFVMMTRSDRRIVESRIISAVVSPPLPLIQSIQSHTDFISFSGACVSQKNGRGKSDVI